MTIFPDETPKAEAPAPVNSKALWEHVNVLTANYKGMQWNFLATAVLLMAKGSKDKTIRDRLTKAGISWASKVVTMAARISDANSLGDDAMTALLELPTAEAIVKAMATIEGHCATLKTKNFDQYYYVCGQTEFNDTVKRTLERLKAKKAEKVEPAPKAEPSAEAEPAALSLTPLQHAIAAVTAILGDTEAVAAFDEWYAGIVSAADPASRGTNVIALAA